MTNPMKLAVGAREQIILHPLRWISPQKLEQFIKVIIDQHAEIEQLRKELSDTIIVTTQMSTEADEAESKLSDMRDVVEVTRENIRRYEARSELYTCDENCLAAIVHFMQATIRDLDEERG